MSFSKAITLGCMATLVMAASVQGWGAERVFPPIKQPLGGIAPIALSNADISGGTSKGYRPWFENGSWQGDLVEYTVTASGGLSTSVDFSQTSPRNLGSKTNWSALVKFAETIAANPTYWDSTRKIITFNSISKEQVAFRFTDAGIGAANKAQLEPAAPEGASKILNFVRGDRSNEFPSGALMRKRTAILGDIIHSKPVYVGAPNDTRTEDGYAAWAVERKDRAPRIYVGANDGMLHVFNAANGEEVYAYVPSMLMSSLGTLTARPYEHRYFVDGEMNVRDAYFGDKWHTVLAGSLGAGGKGFFILDITDPDLTSESANTGTNKKVLFEYGASGDKDLGDSFSRPVIAKLNDGDWYIITGNGYNSTNGVAMLYLVNLDTFSLTKISTSSGTAANPNGLSSPSLLDTNRDGTADYAYAGDIDGNLWKFDLKAVNKGGWEVAYNGSPLHPTAGNQAIVHAPQIALHPQRGYMLYFATGRLFTTADLNDTSVQSLYGVWDSGNTPPNANSQNLLEQTWDGPKTYNYTTGGSAATQTIAIYNPDAGNPDWSSQHGWKVDFPAGGYRVLQPVQVRANRVKATVYKPNKDQLGDNWLVEAVLADGGPNPPGAPIYDLNIDGILNIADLYNNNSGGGEAEWHVPMMWRQAAGNMSQVTIAFRNYGIDALFVNYLQQKIVPDVPCQRLGPNTTCPSGFLGGHIDVQTYQRDVPPGGEPTKNTDAYDSLTKTVWLDFFKLNFPVSQVSLCNLLETSSVMGQVEIDSNGIEPICGFPVPPSDIGNRIGESEEFIVLVANADLSPGSTLRIGDRSWNVMEYQRQIHNALKNWDPSSDELPQDNDGKPLVFTWSKIKATTDPITRGPGTIVHEFDDRAIIDGGLHPTQPECVGNPTGNGLTKGRWRNGALTVQLVKKDYFTSNPAIAMVEVQQPDDLPPYVTTKEGNRVYTTIDYADNLYETVGGLYVRNDAGHIWESTVFWHFGEFAELANKGRPCYGDAGWKEAVTFELSNDPVSATLAALGLDISSDTLVAAVEGLRLQGCDKQQESCYDRWVRLTNLLELSKEFVRTKSGGAGSGPSGPDGQTPYIIPGGTPATITEGTSYEPGRMSWTDIVK